MAHTLAEKPRLAVVDEFTSVVDRTVAQIGSAALVRAVRRRNQKFVAVTCHYDVIDWLDPDWVFQPHTGAVNGGGLASPRHRAGNRPRASSGVAASRTIII